MLKVYWCIRCGKIFFLQREKDISCRYCSDIMVKLKISYSEYTALNLEERNQLVKNYLQKECDMQNSNSDMGVVDQKEVLRCDRIEGHAWQ